MALHKVKTTMQPDKTIEVEEAEYQDLLGQGLLVDEGKTTKKTSGGGPTGVPNTQGEDD